MIKIAIILLINAGISYMNCRSTGMMWSEAKHMGGMIRANCLVGFGMGVAGFTMVYGYILLLLAPHVLPMFSYFQENPEMIAYAVYLSERAIYLLVMTAAIPMGFFIWFQSFKRFWERKTLGNALNLGWNTFAQVHNTMNFVKQAPLAFGDLMKGLTGGSSSNRDGKGAIVAVVIGIVILALTAGYFTARAIRNKADEKYDEFDRLKIRYDEKLAGQSA